MDKYAKNLWYHYKRRFMWGLVMVIILFLIGILTGCDKFDDSENYIHVDSIDTQRIISAELTYGISSEELEGNGFYIYIWFKTPQGDMAYGDNKVRLFKRSGTITFTHSLLGFSDGATFYYMLAKQKSDGFTPLAETNEYHF